MGSDGDAKVRSHVAGCHSDAKELLSRCQFARCRGRLASDPRALAPCCLKPRPCPFGDQLALNLANPQYLQSERCVQEEATCRCARVDAVRQAHEVDPVLLEVAHEIDQLLDAPPQTVLLPDDERVASPELVERLEKPRAVSYPPTGRVLVDLLAASHPKCLHLQVETLVSGRDPGVADQHIHSSGGRFSKRRG